MCTRDSRARDLCVRSHSSLSRAAPLLILCARQVSDRRFSILSERSLHLCSGVFTSRRDCRVRSSAQVAASARAPRVRAAHLTAAPTCLLCARFDLHLRPTPAAAHLEHLARVRIAMCLPTSSLPIAACLSGTPSVYSTCLREDSSCSIIGFFQCHVQ